MTLLCFASSGAQPSCPGDYDIGWLCECCAEASDSDELPDWFLKDGGSA